MRTPKHTEVRHKTFYAVLGIPKDVRPAFGHKLRLIQSLKTDSFAEAEDRSVLVVHQWKRLIAKARQSHAVANTDLSGQANLTSRTAIFNTASLG